MTVINMLVVKLKSNRRINKAFWYYRLIKWRIYKTKQSFRKRMRLLFPSPAETRFIQLMGGRVIIVPFIRSRRNDFPIAYVVSLGRILNRERVQREVRAGAMYIDFGIDNAYYKKGIEIDGRNFHRDIVKETERDEYVRQYGWQLLHIQADVLYREPYLVQQRVLEWLQK